MPLRPGDAVEHFVIVSLLGEGGMGQVYAARDTRLQRSVALKIVQPEPENAAQRSQASDGAARLLREAQAAAALEHPNVVTIYEVGAIGGDGPDAGRPFIAMELVRGRALRAFIGDTSVPMRERLRWLADVARALACAHRAGLVHRDMKPENVMVREDGTIKVLDFGVAKRAASPATSSTTSTEAQLLPSLTAKGVAVGTPYYMAPEQMRREPLDGRADQFAWAVMAYELLSGTPPWGREVDALELVSRVLSAEPPPLAETSAELPAHVADVIARAMAKKRAERFATMEDLVAELEQGPIGSAPTLPAIPVEERDAPSEAEQRVRTASTRPPPPRTRLWVRPVAGIALGAVLGLAAFLLLHRGAVKAPPLTAAPTPECMKSTECVAKSGGKPAVCSPAGRCAAIESADCKALFEPTDLESDSTVWLGAMFPTTGPNAADYGLMNLAGADLARSELARATTSVRSDRVRPLALVACDDETDAGRAARHLTDDIGVPAILGFRSGQEVVDLAGSLLIPRHVLAVATLTSSPVATRVPQPAGEPHLVWRTTFSLDGVATATAAILASVLEPRAPAGDVRVALVHTDSAAGQAFGETFFRALRFNGKTALDNGDRYLEVVVAQSAGADGVQGVVDRLVAAQPTFVVLLGSGDLTAKIVELTEVRWPRARRPDYVVASNSTRPFAHVLGANAERRSRLFAVESVSTRTSNARFVVRYNESHPDKVTRVYNPSASYDATYLLAYALYASPKGAVTGLSLATSIGRLLPPGPTIEVGPTSVFSALSALGSGSSIDLQGTSSDLDFDPATGEAPNDFALVCAAIDERGRATGDDVESGVIYSDSLRRVTGAPKCP